MNSPAGNCSAGHDICCRPYNLKKDFSQGHVYRVRFFLNLLCDGCPAILELFDPFFWGLKTAIRFAQKAGLGQFSNSTAHLEKRQAGFFGRCFNIGECHHGQQNQLYASGESAIGVDACPRLVP